MSDSDLLLSKEKLQRAKEFEPSPPTLAEVLRMVAADAIGVSTGNNGGR
jgi:hypothetical protein